MFIQLLYHKLTPLSAKPCEAVPFLVYDGCHIINRHSGATMESGLQYGCSKAAYRWSSSIGNSFCYRRWLLKSPIKSQLTSTHNLYS